jgi:hypothetical protein
MALRDWRPPQQPIGSITQTILGGHEPGKTDFDQSMVLLDDPRLKLMIRGEFD